MNAGRKFFGTDGIRGRVGEAPITADFVLKLGWAAGRVFADDPARTFLIGKDTRISGYMIESALEAGLSAAGVNIRLLGPMPTPAVAYLTRTMHASGGIVISASHNPYYDNGIKFFSSRGTKLADDVERAIEARLDEPMETVDAAALGKAARVDDAAGRYIEFCKSTFPAELKLEGLRLVVDCANGATYHVAPQVFRELGAQVDVIAASPDGLNINRDCGSTHPESARERVKKTGATAGIVLDGDGDRVVLIDESGELLDGDEMLFIIARAQHMAGGLSGGVVGTVMSNLGMEKALLDLGIPFARASVGDRHVLEELKARRWKLGGEASGHIICLDRTTTGDGIVAALQVLAVAVESGQSLKELRSGMTKYPQLIANVRTRQRVDLSASVPIQKAIVATEARLGEEGRVILRASGTEPVIRVTVEGPDPQLVQTLTDELTAIVESEFGEAG